MFGDAVDIGKYLLVARTEWNCSNSVQFCSEPK